MPLTKEAFGNHLISLLAGNNITISENDKFKIIPIKEDNVTYNSFDDYVRLWFLKEENIDRYFSFEEAINFLSFSNERYPLWIRVRVIEDYESYTLFWIVHKYAISKTFRTEKQRIRKPSFYI